MMQTSTTSQWIFRSTLNDSEKLNVKANSTALAAFTPDIIPLDQIKATPTEVAASYKHFVSHSIDRDEASTLIYVRAKASSPASSIPTKVHFYAVENHLVLWPAVIQQAQHVGSTTLDLCPGKTRKYVGVGGPIAYTPIALPGKDRHETIIAVQEELKPKLQDLSKNIQNWRDLANHIGGSTDLAFYNVMTAESCAAHTKLTTKLHLPENETSSVKLYIGLEAIGIPENVEASLSVGDASSTRLTIERQPLNVPKDFGSYFSVPANFSGEVTLQIFNDKSEVIGDYSSVSITLFAVNAHDGTETLLGAEHVVFDSNPRVKRLVHKFKRRNRRRAKTTQLRLEEDDDDDDARFYFRAELGETADTPKNGEAYYSPDIQPMGNTAISDPKSVLSNQNTDISTNDQIEITSNNSNYIYLRGHTTVPHKGDVRLFFMPNTVLLHPAEWSQTQYMAMDVDPNDPTKSWTAVRGYNSTSSGTQLIIFDEPFLLADLPTPPEGHDHYCLIAECKPHRTQEELDDGDPPYTWPHEDVDEIQTNSEFAVWIAGNRRVVQRNMSVTCDNDGATYNKRQAFKLQKGSVPTDVWHYSVHAENCPHGSAFSMDSTSAEINYPYTDITIDDQGGYAEFTGKKEGFSAQVVLHWFANGNAIQTGQTLSGELSLSVHGTSNAAKYVRANAKSGTTPKKPASDAPKPKRRLHVGEEYPVLIVPSKSRAPGRLKLGGALKARRVTKRPRKAKELKAYSGSGSDSSDNPYPSDSTEPHKEDLLIGSDAINFG